MIATSSPSPSVLDWVTLGMAVLGLFVAALSLGWQIVEWMLSGSLVKATIGFALSAEGLTPGARLLSIAASNVGRARASVTSWAVMLPDKRTIVPAVQPDMWQGPDVPKGLDVGDGATWYVLLDPMVQARRNAGYTTATDVRATVVLGTGKRVTSRKGVGYEREALGCLSNRAPLDESDTPCAPTALPPRSHARRKPALPDST